MHVQFDLLPQFILHFIVLVLLLLFLLPLFEKVLAVELQLLPLQVEVNQLALLVLLLADDADLLVGLDLLQSLARNDMPALPVGHKFIEAIILQFRDGTGDIILTIGWSTIDDDLTPT